MASLPPIDLPRGVSGAGAFDRATTDDPTGVRFDYLLRLGDDSLVLGQRLSEWTGHAPSVEVDLSLANMALDLIGQATFFLNHAGEVERQGRDGDGLAFHRDVLDFRNCLMVEQPNGDFDRIVADVLAEAGLAQPPLQRPILGGRRGHHSEHLGHLLCTMQFLPRTYPDAAW